MTCVHKYHGGNLCKKEACFLVDGVDAICRIHLSQWASKRTKLTSVFVIPMPLFEAGMAEHRRYAEDARNRRAKERAPQTYS
jgi:hypothetical protein